MKLFCLVLLFLGAALAYTPELLSQTPQHFENHVASANKAFSTMLKTRKMIQQLKVPSFSHIASEKRSACDDAQMSFFSLLTNSTECEGISIFFDVTLNTATDNELIEYLTNICSSDGCISKISSSLVNIVSICGANTVVSVEEVKNAIALMQIPCLKEGTTFCLLKFRALASNPPSNDVVTAQQLDNLCHPCVRKVASFLAQLGGEDHVDFAGLDLICLKDGSKYCVITLREVFEDIAGGAGDSPAQIQKFLQLICENRCFSKFLSVAIAYNASDALSSAEFFKHFGNVCSKNGDKYCLSIVMETITSINLPDCEPSATCSSECKSAVGTILSKFGCCINTFLGFIEASSAGNPDEVSASEVRKWVTQACGHTLQPPCKPNKKIVLFLTIRNLRHEFVKENEQMVKELLKLDIALSAGVNGDSVTIVGYTKIGDNVQFEIEIQVDSSSFVTQTANELKSNGQYVFNNLASLPPNSKSNVLEPFTAEKVTVTTVSNSATGVVASIFLVALATILSLLF